MDTLCERYKKDVELLRLLEAENKKLSKLVDYDWLTGVYNRGAVQTKINEILRKRKTGILFVMDVNSFKAINDLYGHLCGDETLKAIGVTLNHIFDKEDIYGRIGGDEFVAYIPQTGDDLFIREKETEITNRLSKITYGDNQESLSIAVCGCPYEEGDTYVELFARADHKLLQFKREKRRCKAQHTSICKDKALIREELKEKNVQLGAYCQEYESFKNIYRFMERYLCRGDHKVYLILLTMENDGKHIEQMDMEQLKCSIHRTLRLGDVFTQYSSCQFLIMAMDVNETAIDKMVNRIKTDFYKDNDEVQQMKLCHDCIKVRSALT